MARYEIAGEKFWEITLEGKKFTTRFGKLGAKGQMRLNEFKSPKEAQAAYDKAVAAKVKEGYAEAGGAKPAKGKKGKAAKVEVAGGDARNPELEAAIVANPYDEEAWAIFADWLQEQGDPRGEFMALQLAGKDKEAKKFLAKNEAYLMGPIAAHQIVHDEGYNNASSSLRDKAQEKEWQKTQKQAFLWKHGFIDRLRLSHDQYSDGEWEGKCVDVMKEVFAHPSGRFIVELAFQSNDDPSEDDLQDLIDLIGKSAPPTIRKITFGDNIDQISWHHTGSLAKMWKGVPGLRVLEIETGEVEVGKMAAPNLERFRLVTGGLSSSCGRGIATADIPNIRHLEIYYGDENYGGSCTIKDVKPLLDRTDLKKLEYLGLKNAEFTNDIAKALAGAKILKGIKTLDLGEGTLTDEGALALASAKASLQHLEVLDLSGSFLTKEGLAAVKGLAKKVIVDDQRKPYDWDDELRYYVSVSE